VNPSAAKGVSEREDGRRRVVIRGISPEVDGGRHHVKRTVGDVVRVEADLLVDGHDALRGVLLHRHDDDPAWSETPLEALGNDRWRARFAVTRLGTYRYAVQAWIDRWGTWRRGLRRKLEAGQDVKSDLEVGALLVDEAARSAEGLERAALEKGALLIRAAGATGADARARLSELAGEPFDEAVARHLERRFAQTSPRALGVTVDDERARFGAWYELFPRSCAAEAGRHGTLRDLEERLPHVAAMGFDVVYFPPIHPIGRSHRKGRNGVATAGPDEPGSPWAIGAAEGGHKAIHPSLGAIADFRRLVARARSLDLEIALDVAFQCSPDHPYVREHPEWFRARPDGTIQYAENPPKKYQDIVPFDFECEGWEALWTELTSIVLFWVAEGVRIFRVDNPHTKPFGLWEHLIREVKRARPDAIFLAEAFTRPKVMYELAKLGFTQSYNYFPWRNTRDEITRYFTEITSAEVREFFRPNLWPNTPDILTEFLQTGGRAAFALRLVLAATLGATYGIYGPAFELCEARPRESGSEEYLDSEKYECKSWPLGDQGGIRDLIARVNRIRRENEALHRDDLLEFHAVDNERILCYSKRSEDGSSVIVVAANLDPRHTQRGWIEMRPEVLGVARDESIQAEDLLGGGRYSWSGSRNYVELDPALMPAHILRLRRRVRTERDFDYYL